MSARPEVASHPPQAGLGEQSPPPTAIPRWLDACQGSKPSVDNFDYASALSETVLLGNIAIRSGKKIEWDAKELKITNSPEAKHYLRREYRKGWDLPLVPA